MELRLETVLTAHDPPPLPLASSKQREVEPLSSVNVYVKGICIEAFYIGAMWSAGGRRAVGNVEAQVLLSSPPAIPYLQSPDLPCFRKENRSPVVMAALHAFNPSAWEAEVGGLLSSVPS